MSGTPVKFRKTNHPSSSLFFKRGHRVPTFTLLNVLTCIIQNYCESGATGFTLGGIGGLAPAFIDISCGAVIGTLWSVDDNDALEVAKTFYYRVAHSSEPISIASVLKEIRQKFSDEKKDTFLAYTFFGDPHAILSFENRTLERRPKRRGPSAS